MPSAFFSGFPQIRFLVDRRSRWPPAAGATPSHPGRLEPVPGATSSDPGRVQTQALLSHALLLNPLSARALVGLVVPPPAAPRRGDARHGGGVSGVAACEASTSP